jgi:hypothetical protein
LLYIVIPSILLFPSIELLYVYIYIAIFKLAIAGSSSLGAQALIDALVQGLEKHQGQLRGSAVEVHGKRWEKTGKLEVEQCGTCFF